MNYNITKYSFFIIIFLFSCIINTTFGNNEILLCQIQAIPNIVSEGNYVKIKWQSNFKNYNYINNGIGFVENEGSRVVYLSKPGQLEYYLKAYDGNKILYCKEQIKVIPNSFNEFNFESFDENKIIVDNISIKESFLLLGNSENYDAYYSNKIDGNLLSFMKENILDSKGNIVSQFLIQSGTNLYVSNGKIRSIYKKFIGNIVPIIQGNNQIYFSNPIQVGSNDGIMFDKYVTIILKNVGKINGYAFRNNNSSWNIKNLDTKKCFPKFPFDCGYKDGNDLIIKTYHLTDFAGINIQKINQKTIKTNNDEKIVILENHEFDKNYLLNYSKKYNKINNYVFNKIDSFYNSGMNIDFVNSLYHKYGLFFINLVNYKNGFIGKNSLLDYLKDFVIVYKIALKKEKEAKILINEVKSVYISHIIFGNNELQKLYNNYIKVFNNKKEDILKYPFKYKVGIANSLNKFKHFGEKIFIEGEIAINSNNYDKVSSKLNVLGGKIELFLNSTNIFNSSHFFSWPVTGKLFITNYFNKSNLGIDVLTEKDSKLYSPADGVVYNSSNNWILIFHKNGMISYINNIHKVTAKQGDYIPKGYIIGNNEGNEIHIQLIKNGRYIDPLFLFDLTVYTNQIQDLPDKYHFKYNNDKQKRLIDLSSVKYFKGDTLGQRRVNFLNKYGIGEFSNIQLWENASKFQGIDIDLGICIGFAETQLGKNYAREGLYNVGNVGNNDRGDRKGYDSPLHGAKAIFYALNNKYLGKYNTIDLLSRFGNKTGKIYASSQYNWQKNVLKCLTSIKGYWVPQDYAFRN